MNLKGGLCKMHKGYIGLFIFLAGLGFYLLTGDVSISILLIVLLSYFEFRKKNSHY